MKSDANAAEQKPMNENCTCIYCSNKVNEQFCITCGYNYNSCESFYEAHEKHVGDLPALGNSLCPKCCHKDWKPEIYPGFIIIKKRDKADE